MISLPLDPKKLLGFKLIPLTPAKPSAATAIKLGGKSTIQLGAKLGVKLGTKGASPVPRS